MANVGGGQSKLLAPRGARGEGRGRVGSGRGKDTGGKQPGESKSADAKSAENEIVYASRA